MSHLADPETQPLWNKVIDMCGGDYDQAVTFICRLRELVCVVDPSRGEDVTNAIRRAQYEEALEEALFD